jgi:hypothetical protein
VAAATIALVATGTLSQVDAIYPQIADSFLGKAPTSGQGPLADKDELNGTNVAVQSQCCKDIIEMSILTSPAVLVENGLMLN